MVVHPGIEAGLAILGEGVGRHGDDRHRRPPGQGTDLPRGLQALGHRHLHVHQHQVVGGLAHPVYGLAAVFGEIDVQPDTEQQFAGHFAVDRVVIDEQDAPRAARAQALLWTPGAMYRRRAVRGAARQQALDRVVHPRRGQRLAQHFAVASALETFRRLAAGGDQQAQRLPGEQRRRQLAAERDAVEAWHVPVGEYDVEGFAVGLCSHHGRQRGAAVG